MILAYILTIYLAYSLAFDRAYSDILSGVPSGILPGIFLDIYSYILAGGWGQAVPDAIGSWQGGWGEEERKEEGRRGENTFDKIKSNNPDLAGGKKSTFQNDPPSLSGMHFYWLQLAEKFSFSHDLRPFYSASFHSGRRGLKPRLAQYALALSTGVRKMAAMFCFNTCSWKRKQQQLSQQVTPNSAVGKVGKGHYIAHK